MKPMFRNLSVLGLSVVLGVAVGCGPKTSDRATETPPGPSNEEMKDYMEESMKRGGMEVEIPDPTKDDATSEENTDESSN